MKPPKPRTESYPEAEEREISDSESLCSLTSDSSEYDDCEKDPDWKPKISIPKWE